MLSRRPGEPCALRFAMKSGNSFNLNAFRRGYDAAVQVSRHPPAAPNFFFMPLPRKPEGITVSQWGNPSPNKQIAEFPPVACRGRRGVVREDADTPGTAAGRGLFRRCERKPARDGNERRRDRN